MAQVFKSPLDQAESLKQPNGYDRARVLNFLENFGDHVTDDSYLDFAKERGITPGTPDEKRGYYNEYIKNEDFLKHVYDELDKYGEWEDEDEVEYKDIDEDYERSYGPVDTQEKYNAYLKWKKEGN